MKLIKKVFISILIFSTLLLLTSCKKEYQISLHNWYDFKKGETIFTVKAENVVWNCKDPYDFDFAIYNSKENVLELAQNTPYYIGEYQIEQYEEIDKGALLFSNNNYYFIYNNQKNDRVINLLLSINYGDGDCYIPFPIFDEYSSYIYTNASFQHVLNKYTYKEIKSFYSRFDDYIQLNDAEETIEFRTKAKFKEEDIVIKLNYKEKYLSIVEQEERILFTNQQ